MQRVNKKKNFISNQEMNLFLYTGVLCLLLFNIQAGITTAQTPEEIPTFNFRSRPTNVLPPSLNIIKKPRKPLDIPLNSKQINSIQTTTPSVASKTTTEISDVTEQSIVGNYPRPDGNSVESDSKSSSVLPLTATTERIPEETISGEPKPLEHNHSSSTLTPSIILYKERGMGDNNNTGSPENESCPEQTTSTSNTTADIFNVTGCRRSEATNFAQFAPQFEPRSNYFLRGSATIKSILPSHGLIHTILTAYNDNLSLVLTPDDIWTAILVQLSLHVNLNAIHLRHQLVSPNGTKKLTFKVMSSEGAKRSNGITRSEWINALRKIPTKLKRALNSSLINFVENNFSTTTGRTRIVSRLAVLSTIQHNYEGKFQIHCGGIPQITILGKENDWIEIARRVNFLRTFGDTANKWSDILTPIIGKFISAKRGNVDGEFWGNIVRIQKESESVCGYNKSGSETVLDGWLTAFAVFDGQGNWQGKKLSPLQWPEINIKSIASGVVTVPIKLMKKNLKNFVKATIFAGHLGYHLSDDKGTLIPYSGWAVTSHTPIKLAKVHKQN